MTRLSRVLVGAVMLVVLLGLPVAPVWCELACPQAHEVASPGVTHEPSPCHEVPPVQVPTLDSRLTLSAATATGCDHPSVASARLPDVRVGVPAPAGVVVLSHLAPLAPAAAGRAVAPAARGPAPPRGPTFSPVLRI